MKENKQSVQYFSLVKINQFVNRFNLMYRSQELFSSALLNRMVYINT